MLMQVMEKNVILVALFDMLGNLVRLLGSLHHGNLAVVGREAWNKSLVPWLEMPVFEPWFPLSSVAECDGKDLAYSSRIACDSTLG